MSASREPDGTGASQRECDRLRRAMRHVINDSPGTPDSVKKYLLRELEGSWGEPYEERLTEQEYAQTMDAAADEEALYDAREYLIAGLENQAEWWEHLGDAHRDYAALARAAASLQSRYEFDASIPLEDLRECITYLIEAVGEWFAGDVPPQLANDWRFKRAEEAVRVQT